MTRSGCPSAPPNRVHVQCCALTTTANIASGLNDRSAVHHEYRSLLADQNSSYHVELFLPEHQSTGVFAIDFTVLRGSVAETNWPLARESDPRFPVRFTVSFPKAYYFTWQ